MSYSLVLLRRRLETLERLPSARAPLVIKGGLPVGYDPGAARSPGLKQTDSSAAKPTKSLGQPGAE
jgi:hypothetical protein